MVGLAGTTRQASLAQVVSQRGSVRRKQVASRVLPWTLSLVCVWLEKTVSLVYCSCKTKGVGN